MHSEMMAINAALTSSSAAAAAAVSHAKPYLKVPGGGGKQKRLLRRDALAAYVQRVCLEALGQGVSGQQPWRSPPRLQHRTGFAQSDEWLFETCASRHATAAERESERERAEEEK
jgi:hypothetical protein